MERQEFWRGINRLRECRKLLGPAKTSFLQPNCNRGLVAITFLALMLFSQVQNTAHAILIDRGGGLIYDDVLNVTWLQDASYSQTSGYNDAGRLNWRNACDWAAQLNYFDVIRGVTWSDWRLPSTINDPTSLGYDLTGRSSELAYMYYVNLGYSPNYSHNRFDPAPTSNVFNPFINLNYRGYWSGTQTDNPNRLQAWYFHFHFGSQEIDNAGTEQRVWAVRDGDVAGQATPVPEPTTTALLGCGIAGLSALRRRKRN